MTSNYTDRSVDLLIFQGVKERNAVINLGFGTQGFICTGIQKIAQSFLAFLLSDANSVYADSSYGSDFWRKLRFGQLYNDIDFIIEFNFAASDFIKYENLSVTDTTPDDEVVVEINLIDFVITKSLIELTVQITTLAGSAREFFIPLSLAIK